MRRIISILSLSLICFLNLCAQALHPPVQGLYSSTGSCSQHFLDAFSFTANPATLASQQSINAGAFAARPFTAGELNLYALALGFPAASGGIGLQVQWFGLPEYNESKLGLGYGKSLGKMLSLGLQFNYYMYHMTGYGNAGAMNFELGALLHPGEKINIGLYISQPAGSMFGKKSGERLASLYKMAIGYEASEQVFAGFEIIKEEEKRVGVNAALHYAFAKTFFAGIGIMTITASPYGWAGWAWKDLRIDITVSHHPQLGFTPGIALFLGSVSAKKEDATDEP